MKKMYLKDYCRMPISIEFQKMSISSDIMLFYHFTTAVIWWFHTVWFLFRKTGMICAVVGKAAAALRELPVWFIT